MKVLRVASLPHDRSYNMFYFQLAMRSSLAGVPPELWKTCGQGAVFRTRDAGEKMEGIGGCGREVLK